MNRFLERCITALVLLAYLALLIAPIVFVAAALIRPRSLR